MTRRLSVSVGLALLASCAPEPETELASALPPTPADWVGSATCKTCHPNAYAAWEQSHHALAEVDLESPRAIPGALLGRTEDAMAERAIGVAPLVQYIVNENGLDQVCQFAWDPTAQEWFNIFEDGREEGEWGHWTGRGMNWDSMCATCHNTGLRKEWNPATDRYTTTHAERGVSCEACHGPGRTHVESQGSIPFPAAANSVDACGACHARRGELIAEQRPDLPFLDRFLPEWPGLDETWYADGQIREEDYEWTSFRLSRMAQAGVTCLDCHNAHDSQPRLPGDALCMRCHAEPQGAIPPVDPAAHTFHPPESEGARCIGCHMPTTTYMQRDPRHDHSFSVPDPVLTLELGIPNACNRCHADQDAVWARNHVRNWYGDAMDRPRRTRARLLAAARQGKPDAWQEIVSHLKEESHPAWQAVLTGALMAWPEQPEVVAALMETLNSEDPFVRLQTLRALGPTLTMIYPRGTGPLRHFDTFRANRVEAAMALGPRLDPESQGAQELDAFLQHNRDQPPGAAAWSTRLQDQGRPLGAAAELRRALGWDPTLTLLREQLAVVEAQAQRPA